METIFSIFIDILVKIVPFVVPIILPPFIIKAVKIKGKGGRFLPYIFISITLLTWLAALFSSTFLTILFGLPLVGGGVDLSFSYIMDVINHIPFLSPFLISIYLTFVFIVISLFNDRLHKLLERGYTTLEKAFDYFDIVNPVAHYGFRVVSQGAAPRGHPGGASLDFLRYERTRKSRDRREGAPGRSPCEAVARNAARTKNPQWC